MTRQVYISGQLGKAVFEDGGRRYVVSAENPSRPTECRPPDLSLLFGFGAEFTSFADERPSLERVAATLKFQTRAHRALSLALSGLDKELDNDTRSLAIESSQELLRDELAYNFARARLLARPLPEGADLEGALLLADYTKSALVKNLYDEMLEVAGDIPVLLESWNEAALEHFATRGEQDEGESLLIDAGVFADLSLSVARGDLPRLNNLVVKHGLNSGLKEKLPQISHLLNSLRSLLVEKGALKPGRTSGARLEKSPVEKKRRAFETIGELLKGFRKGRGGKKSKRLRATEAKEKVDRQIAAIEAQLRRGNISLAERYLQDLIRFQVAHSEREHLAMSLCSLAKTAIDTHALELAETMLDYAFSLGLNDAVIWRTKAELLKAMGCLEEALATYDETALLFSDNAITRGGRAGVLQEMGWLDEALTAYDEAIELFPEDEVVRGGRAEVLKEMGGLDEALAAYDETIRLFPQDEVARNGRAEVLKAMGHLSEALDAYDEAVELFSGNAFARTGRAEVLKEMGRLDEALAAYDEAMELFPQNEVARGGRAGVLKEMGRLPEALAAYDEAASLFPGNAFTHTGRAEVLKEMGRLDEALAAYDEAIHLFPRDAVVRSGRASLLMLLGRIDEARALLTRDSLLTRNDWIDFHIIAMSYLKTGEIDEAIRRLTYGLENTLWADCRNYFATALGVAKIKRRKFEEALAVLQTNIVHLNAFKRQKSLALIGHSQAALGKRDEAAATLASIGQTANPHLRTLREDVILRFNLPPKEEATVSTEEATALDERIEEKEFYLAMAA